MHVVFTENFNWVQPGFTVAYKAGHHVNVTRACADEAQAAGKAVKATAPKRERADGKKT
ncbi:hypothetical protein IB277_07245 [Ensifer sp. ENS07]|uniref:hypothetical protein n=1 Tax=Ensifer sp. ENS07 TaxID=2769274 RepID=UPI00177F45ED|nr:hypothetical protein [Ensifer sp. ENS07]MBD9636088.1 hypothetical protein [Ensifer sp. ENS07]